MDAIELMARFEYHPPSNEMVVQAHETVRLLCVDLATRLNHLMPECREKSLAMTAIDDACMYANAAIARTQLVGEVVVSSTLPAVTVSRGVVDRLHDEALSQ